MNRARLAVLAVVAVLGTTVATTGSAAASGGYSGPTFYLSLGDSLAQGVQPNAAGMSVETNQGYADQLFQLERDSTKLKLFKMGCPGETSTTMIAGGICTYKLGSQLASAVNFLTAHRGHTAFVTLDIGANDIDSCVSGFTVNLTCIQSGFNAVATNLPVILAALRAADPKAQMVGMNYYDPFLAVWLTGASGQGFAVSSLGLADPFNALLGGIYAGAGFPVADVAGDSSSAFFTDDLTLVPFSPPLPAGGSAPHDVVLICAYTWMCAPSPVGPNIHANQLGYSVIAAAFAAQIIFP